MESYSSVDINYKLAIIKKIILVKPWLIASESACAIFRVHVPRAVQRHSWMKWENKLPSDSLGLYSLGNMSAESYQNWSMRASKLY